MPKRPPLGEGTSFDQREPDDRATLSLEQARNIFARQGEFNLGRTFDDQTVSEFFAAYSTMVQQGDISVRDSHGEKFLMGDKRSRDKVVEVYIKHRIPKWTEVKAGFEGDPDWQREDPEVRVGFAAGGGGRSLAQRMLSETFPFANAVEAACKKSMDESDRARSAYAQPKNRDYDAEARLLTRPIFEAAAQELVSALKEMRGTASHFIADYPLTRETDQSRSLLENLVEALQKRGGDPSKLIQAAEETAQEYARVVAPEYVSYATDVLRRIQNLWQKP